MRLNLFLGASLATSSIAAPTLLRGLTNALSTLTEPIQDIKQLLDTSTTCDTSRISLPKSGFGLPVPDGQMPIYVAVGRGTQVSKEYPPKTYDIRELTPGPEL